MPEATSGVLKRLERWGTAAENASLVLLLTAMMLLAVGQIVLRIFFNIGFVWTDELISLMVLWIALIASIAAVEVQVIQMATDERISVMLAVVNSKFAGFSSM